ncbi:MAG: 2OG-Fe(II) oxygenase [Actinobacteria bacterium]|nr:MAG: 2OG-Fe(II) oxygenase [Actinomycetota bacterium]
MDAAVHSASERFHFDREALGGLAESRRAGYVSARPFPHTVIDDFLPADVLDEVLAEFPSAQQTEWFAFDSPRERKLATKDDATMGEATRRLLAELNSAAFIDFLERLTGIDGLVPDPHFVGGGLHQIERGGHLKVHADFNRHPRTDLERRLNLLVYLNHDWKDEYGGALELWNRDMSACEARILPIFNRCVVFSTTDTSFHGHPEPLNCPEGWTRKSIALYYYSKDRPDGGGDGAHNTLFQVRPGEAFPTELEEPADAQPAPAHRQLGPRLKAGARQLVPPILWEAVRRLRARRA